MRLCAALALAVFPALVAADGAVPVTLPTVPEMSVGESEALLKRLVIANVVSANCAGFEVDMADWGLLTGTADLVAARLGLSVDAYDAGFYGPAFDLLDQPGACASFGPDVRPVLDLIADWGGARSAK